MYKHAWLPFLAYFVHCLGVTWCLRIFISIYKYFLSEFQVVFTSTDGVLLAPSIIFINDLGASRSRIVRPWL